MAIAATYLLTPESSRGTVLLGYLGGTPLPPLGKGPPPGGPGGGPSRFCSNSATVGSAPPGPDLRLEAARPGPEALVDGREDLVLKHSRHPVSGVGGNTNPPGPFPIIVIR